MLANGVDISSRCEDEIYILGIGRVDLVLTFFLKENNIFILTCGPNQIYIFLLLLYIPLKLYDDEKTFNIYIRIRILQVLIKKYDNCVI